MNRAQARIAVLALLLMPAATAVADDPDASGSKIIVDGADSASIKSIKVPAGDPCATRPCLRAGGQWQNAPDLKPEPKDLTLQYPGHDPPSISPKDALDAAGKIAEGSRDLVKKAGPVAREAVEDMAHGASKIVAPATVIAAATKGYEQKGMSGAAAGAAKEVIKQGVGVVVTAGVTAECGPLAGVAAGVCAEHATDAVMEFAEKHPPAPGDASFNCAKVGNCGSSNPSLNFSKVLKDSGVSGSSNASVNISNVLKEAGVTGPVDTRNVDLVTLQAAIRASNEAAQAREAYARQQAILARVQAQILAAEARTEREEAQEKEEQGRSDDEARAQTRERRRREREARRATWEARWGQTLTAQQAWVAAQQQAAAAWTGAFDASPSHPTSGSIQSHPSGRCSLPPVPKSWSSLHDRQRQLDEGSRNFDGCEKKLYPAAAPATNPLAGFSEMPGGFSTTLPAQQSSATSSK
jgi:hypothetical protein